MLQSLNRPARIVHVLRTLDIGGTTKTAQLFTTELSKFQDYDVYVLYNARGDLTRFQKFERGVGSTHMIPYMSEYAGTEILESLKPDIVHVYRSGLPEWPKQPKQSLFVETNVFGHYDFVNPPDKSLFMSNWLCKQAKNMYGDSAGFDFINNPTESPVTDHTFDRQELFAKDLMPNDTVIVGRCGRADDGIYDDISLKAILLLQNKYPIHFLVMSPPPRMKVDLERFGISHTIIEPTIDEYTLSKFYNTIDIYCHARADGETFGNNIAEAMAHRKPVITHRAVPNHTGMGVFQAQTELVEDDITGYVVDHQPASYRKALETLIQHKDHALSLGTGGWAKFRLELISGLSCQKLCATYNDLIYHNSHLLRKY